MSRRTAASGALYGSLDKPTSRLKAKVTFQQLNLILDLGQNGEKVSADQDLSTVLKCREQVKRLVQIQRHKFRGT